MAQRRVLIRARGLATFRRALVDLAVAGGPLAARRRVVLVPSRAAAALLRQAIEEAARERAELAVVCPDLLTRDEWLARMQWAVPNSPRWLSRLDRLIALGRAVETALTCHRALVRPFESRPGLLSAMLDLYDDLHRRQRRVRTFARTIFDELRVERGTDRGSDGLIDQTCFLGFVYLAYQRAVRAGGAMDEHELRRVLLATQPALPFDDLVVAVADHPADLRGLWPADFDLIGRLRTLGQVHVVMTDEAHDAGFRERVEHELPDIEEERAPDVARAPVLIGDEGRSADETVPIDLRRDREEELRQVARQIRVRAAEDGHYTIPTAIVFHRPLPYLYLARQVLTEARVPYQAFDALPLAVEPVAALLDLALAVVRTDGSRPATMELLRSPLATFVVDGEPVVATDVHALDALLSERQARGGAATFGAEVDRWASGAGRRQASRVAGLRRAARAAASIVERLADCRQAPSACRQVQTLARFLREVQRPSARRDERPARARAALLGVLDALADACARFDDRPRSHDDLAATIHHAIEAHTFAPARDDGGVHLVDAASARFGEFDDVYLVGLVDADWSERPRRNVFYGSGLLRSLGWPQDADQSRAQQAAFRDVLSLARHRTRLSAFQLDGDVVAAISPILEEARSLSVEFEPAAEAGAVFDDERLASDEPGPAGDEESSRWLAARVLRPDLDQPAYSGIVDSSSGDWYRVSQVDRYVTCPFKYFAAHVLHLEEERSDAAGLTPLERGTLLHRLFEEFYAKWQALGHGAITPANLPDAQRLAAEVVDELLGRLPPAERAVERLRLLGSIVGPGAVDRVLELEAASTAGVATRRIEVPIEGTFTFPTRGGLTTKSVAVKGKADRVDVLDDGSLRVIDYKLGRLPDVATSVQVAVYAYCVRQLLETDDGRAHPVAAAMYLAFGDDRRFEGKLPGGSPAEVSVAVESRAGQFGDAVVRIEEGVFPPRPLTTTECQWCGYAGVCRKEYRVDDDVAAEPV